MQIVQPCCRDHLTAEDLNFLVSVLADGSREQGFLTRLLTETESRDNILDNRRLLDALADSPYLTAISPYLYFYIIVRNGFRSAGIEDRNVADYVADILAEFMRSKRLTNPLDEQDRTFTYLVDLLQAAAEAHGPGVEFALRCHLGNYALFLSGLYPEAIEARRRHHAAPGLDYYEKLGSASFHMASHLRLAGEYKLEDLLEMLAANFHFIRETLHDLALRRLFLGSTPQAA